MSLYDRLPEDLILLLLEYFDCQSILLSCKLSLRFREVCEKGKMLPILQRKIKETTGFNIDNIDQLTKLCRYSMYNKRQYIFAGPLNSYIIVDGVAYVFGDSTYGFDEWTNKETPTILNINNIVQISSSGRHTLYLDSEGQVYFSGYNDYGQLGIGNIEWEGGEQLHPYLTQIVSIAVGNNFSLALNNQGQVYGFGDNNNGQLGLGDNNDRDMPTLISGLNNIVQIVSNEIMSALLTNNGHVYISGSTFENNMTPILISGLNDIIKMSIFSDILLALNDQGQVYMYYYIPSIPESDKPSLILNNLVQVRIGYHNIVALTVDGLIYVLSRLWGDKFNDTLVDIPVNVDYNIFQGVHYTTPILVPNLSNVVQIAVGSYHVLALTNTGDIYAFGQNDEGQLGLGDLQPRKIPTRIPNLKINL